MSTDDDAQPQPSLRDPARWVVALQEPLLEPATQVRLFDAARRWADASPDMAAAWLSGVLWQVVATLPGDDPWRKATARWPLLDGTELARGATPDGAYGAFLGDHLFGAEGDITDIVRPSNADRSIDSALAAVEAGITAEPASVLALAIDDPARARILLDDLGARKSGARALDAGAAALRWALWRRRIYLGRDDPYFRVVAFAWFANAERIVSGQRIDMASCRLEIASESVKDGSWADLRGMFASHPFFSD